MRGFIEIHRVVSTIPVCLNVDSIFTFNGTCDDKNGTIIQFKDGKKWTIVESYDAVKTKIDAALAR